MLLYFIIIIEIYKLINRMNQQIKIFSHDYYQKTIRKEKQQKIQKKDNRIGKNQIRNSKENITKENCLKKTRNTRSLDKQYKSLSLLKKQNKEKAYFQCFNFLKNRMKQKNAKSKQQINPQIKNQYEISTKKRKPIWKAQTIDIKEIKQPKKKVKEGTHQKAKKKRKRSINTANLKEKKSQTAKQEVEDCDKLPQKIDTRENNMKLKFFELKLSKNINIVPKQNQQVSKQYRIKTENSKQVKPKSYYKRKVSKLSKQIQNFKSINCKSEQVLQKMQKVRKKQDNKFKRQRQNYLKEIKKLEEQIKQYRPNIGHIFTYSDFKNGEIVPNELIPESEQSSQLGGLRIKQKSMYQLHRQCTEIMQKYMSEKTNESFDSEGNQVCLSILSREEM